MQPFLKSLLVTAVLIGLSRPAGAVRVSNLDTVPHTVIYEAAGSRTAATIAPDDTVDLIGAPNGRLSLQTMKPKVARSTVQADGLLSGIIWNARIVDVDGNAFNRYVSTTTRLPQTKNNVWLMHVDCLCQHVQARIKFTR